MIIAKITALLALISAIVAYEDITQNNPAAIELILNSLHNKPKKELFQAYHFLFKKEYNLNSEEALFRYRNFKDNLNYIKETNEQNLSFKLGINQLADMTNEEFKAKMLMNPTQFKAQKTRFLQSAYVNFDLMADDQDSEDMAQQGNYTDIDWRNHFNRALNQGQCGSCWAFTASAVMEGNYNKKYNKTLTFSPQQIVDCDNRNGACNGGLPNIVFKFYAKNIGLTTLAKYPYTAKKGEWKPVNITNQIGKVVNYEYCTNDRFEGERVKCCTKDTYYNLLAKGPVALGMDASSRNFQLYRSGVLVFKPTDCKSANHAVTGVGYFNNSVDGEGVIVRNSWGTYWGDKGYFKARYDAANKETCFHTNSIYWPNMQ